MIRVRERDRGIFFSNGNVELLEPSAKDAPAQRHL